MWEPEPLEVEHVPVGNRRIVMSPVGRPEQAAAEAVVVYRDVNLGGWGLHHQTW